MAAPELNISTSLRPPLHQHTTAHCTCRCTNTPPHTAHGRSMSPHSTRHSRSSPLARTSPNALLPTLACAIVFASPRSPARAPWSIRRACTQDGKLLHRGSCCACRTERSSLSLCVICRVSHTCARPDIFAVASLRRRGGLTTGRSWSRALDHRSPSCSASSERLSRL